MDATKMDPEELNVSPYLLRPLRSLADVVRAREGTSCDTQREPPGNVLIFKPRRRRISGGGDVRGPFFS
ncbi:MAG: hypothetical protein ACE5Q3_08200 [Alphaproteobacteria bacterium]